MLYYVDWLIDWLIMLLAKRYARSAFRIVLLIQFTGLYSFIEDQISLSMLV